MLCKRIRFVDYDGNEREEEHYFNLNKAEIIEWITSKDGSYTIDRYIEQVQKEHNIKEMMETFKDLIYRSYGKKSLDGRRFIKTEEVKQEFMETEAYSVLFTELVTDAQKAAAFFNEVVPKDLADEINKILQENPNGIPAEVKDYLLTDAET